MIKRLSKSLKSLIVLLVVVPVVTTLISEAIKSNLVWYFRVSDLVDLFFSAPFYIVILLAMHEYLMEHKADRRLRIAFALCATAFLYGHAMHLSANAINAFSTEIRSYRDILPGDTYQLIYFLDEGLSHFITYSGIYGVLLTLLVYENRVGTTHEQPYKFGTFLGVGLLYGFALAIAFIEGGMVILVPPFVLGSVGLLVRYWRKSGVSGKAFLRQGVITTFFVGLLPGKLLTLLIYLLIFGRFIQPSQMSVIGHIV